MNFKTNIFSLVLLFTPICFSMDKDIVAQLKLPVNHLSRYKAQVELAVNIPDTFKIKTEQISPNCLLYEFVQKNDANPNLWPELITLHSFIGKKVTAAYALKGTRDKMVQGYNGQVIDASADQFESYTARKLALVYTIQNRQELLLAYYASGPYDCAGVQYAIALNAGMDRAQALAKAEKFMKEYVEIRSCPCDSSEAVD